MPDTGLDPERRAMSCQEMQQIMRRSCGLTAAERAHVDRCETCLDAWLDATVTWVLDAKPEVEIPGKFAARIAAGLPAKRNAVSAPRSPSRHWGLFTAILLVAMGMTAMAIADPVRMNTWIGVMFTVLVVAEIAGIALWLGTRHPGVRASRGHSRWSWD
jgi:hypothetical protein